MGVVKLLREGHVIVVGPLELHVSRVTLGSEEVPREDLRVHEERILEEILEGTKGNQERLEIGYQTVKVPFFTEGQKRHYRELPADKVRELFADDARRCIYAAAIQDLDKHKFVSYLAIKDGVLTLFLGGQTVAVEEGTSGFRASKPRLLTVHYFLSEEWRCTLHI